MERSLIRYGVDELINHAHAACGANDREQAQTILDELQHRNARKAATLRAFLMGFLTAPVPSLPPPVAPAPIPSPKPKRLAIAAPPAPSWWYAGCGKVGKTGEPAPARVRARTAEWAAASPAFRAWVESRRDWWARPMAEWPACPERERVELRRANVGTRDWFYATLTWPSEELWKEAGEVSPEIRKLPDGRPNPNDTARWVAYMREAKALAEATHGGAMARDEYERQLIKLSVKHGRDKQAERGMRHDR